MKQIFIITALLFGALGAMAQKEVTKEDVRCSKIKGQTLAEVKAELVDLCDLNKPFSMSLSQLLNDETYLYCCHKKK